MTADEIQDKPEQLLKDWLDGMESAFAYFNMQTGIALDRTPESLDALEQWLLKRYATIDEILEPGEEDYLDCAARYVGETFREHLGGHWEIRFDDPTNIHYGLPRLAGLRDDGPPFCPELEVTTCLARRTGQYLSGYLAKRKMRAERASSS